MAAPPPVDQALLKDVNEGREYRGQPKLTLAQLQAQYGTPFVPPAWPPLAPPVPPVFVGPPAIATPPAGPTIDPDVTNFMAAQFAALTNPANNPPGAAPLTWTFSKLLGAGTFGVVGLWTYTGPAATKPRRTNVAVKQMKAITTDPKGMDLANEQRIMLALSNSRAEHVVQIACLATPLTAVQAAAEGLPAVWAGVTRRIFMEYFPQGSIEGLLRKRNIEQTRFSELTLWLIFNCLVDSISPLEFNATELVVDEVNGTAASPSSAADLQRWQPIIHFDIKPGNLLVGNRNATHTSTPLIKLGDFGLAERFDGTDPQAGRDMRLARFQGTEKYYAPEQFSEAWDFSTCTTSAEVGDYDYRINLWQIANVMWLLAMVDIQPVDIKNPFTPNFPINGAPATGRTYGLNLEATRYSALLRGTIFECLYEMRTQRPTLQALKMTIFDAIKDGLDRDLQIDAWVDFQEPQPTPVAPIVVPAVPPPPPPPGPVPPGILFWPIFNNLRTRAQCCAVLRTGRNAGARCPNYKNNATIVEWFTGTARCGTHP